MNSVCLTVACVCELCCLGLFGLAVVGIYISVAVLLERVCCYWCGLGVVWCGLLFVSAVGFVVFGVLGAGGFGFSFGNCSCVTCFVGCFTCAGFWVIVGVVVAACGWLF